MTRVQVQGVVKRFGETAAIDGVSLDVRPGELFTLVGPSGCGKTTLLRIVAGLLDQDAGSVFFNDDRMDDIPPYLRNIGVVFQSYAIFPHLTVAENIAYGLKARRVPPDRIATKVAEVGRLVQLEALLDRMPSQLSGGQQQRVVLARALVIEPRLLLMDEPLSNLDAKLRNQMRAEIILLRRRLDTTFVYVTHDQTEAMTLGDRIVIMKDGFIQQVGTPQEVFEKPVNLFVAGFIGSPQMNIFNADLIKEQQGRYTVVVQDLRLPIDADKCALMADRGVGSQAVKLGVRPEHAQIHFDNAPDTLEGTLAVNEMMGSEYHLHVITKDEQTIILRTPTVDLSEKQRASLKAGNKLRFSFPSKVIQLFDPKSEQSLLYT